jgi:ribosome-interacting GTPase 1
MSLILEEMNKARISTSKPKSRVEVERRYVGAGLRIILTGKLLDCTFEDVEELLKSYNVRDGVVKIHGEATLGEVEDSIFESTVYKPAVVVANKIDIDGAEGNLKLLKAYLGNRLPVVAVSSKKRTGLKNLAETLVKALEIIRIYTKEPSEKEYSKKPFVLRKNSTIYDLARSIHSDFKDNFNFAKVWSGRLAFSPQKVGANFTLEDGDVVEIHLK